MTVLEYLLLPPSVDRLAQNELAQDEHSFLLPAYCSNKDDIHPKSTNVGEKKLRHFETNNLRDFSGQFQQEGITHWKLVLASCQLNMDEDMSTDAQTIKNFKLLTPIWTPPLKESFSDVNQRQTRMDKNNEMTSKDVDRKKPEGTNRKDLSNPSASTSTTRDVHSTIPSSSINKPAVHDTTTTDHKLLVKKPLAHPSPLNVSNSQLIRGPSLDSSYGFKLGSQNLQDAKAVHTHDYMTIICLDCHVLTRPKFVPDPAKDAVAAVFFTITQNVPDDHPTPKETKGIIVVLDPACESLRVSMENYDVTYVTSEERLMDEVVSLVLHWDPDILVGYDVQKASWGYLIERSSILTEDIISRLSRIPDSQSSYFDKEKDEFGAAYTHEIHIRGRIVLNVWRLMRAEVTLQSYTLENVVYHVLHIRLPQFSFETLTKWWKMGLEKWRTLEHLALKCDLTMQLVNKLDVISRTSELARLFGIPFYDVLSRGTQFRVESMMLRLSRAENMIAISPDIHQRAQMKSPEWLALTMEPESNYYTDPVVLLDFQSLYPSIMIAYNYCYSTCLGRVSSLGEGEEPFVFGASHLKVSPSYLESIIDQINFSPCGVAFVQPSIRKGILPTMLEEILETRIMVKTSMKANKKDASLTRILHSRQLGLKMIANVTYGYTSANYSGRMPCSEVADSVVSKGRETLERAIALVNNSPKWRGKVVYGDTDSLFVHLPGRTKAQAFAIGRDIVKEVTQMNPKPVKLKFEKVYLPCILQTKKRYVGYMYESEDQKEPVFDAKGIETVRRDSCPAVSKILQKALTVLFDTSDVSLVKNYVQRQFTKIYRGTSTFQDLIFAKEYRGTGGYKATACVPALELARQWTKVDKRKEPCTGERVPYVIVCGAPGLPLIKLVRSPESLFTNVSLKINVVYYITRAIIPPLQRCFSLLGVDVHRWFADLPRVNSLEPALFDDGQGGGGGGSTIAHYFVSTLCPSCGDVKSSSGGGGGVDHHPLCDGCLGSPQRAVVALSYKIRDYDRALDHVRKVCRACIGHPLSSVECISLDCPITYRHQRTVRKSRETPRLREILQQLPF